MSQRATITDQILECELAMFLAVPTDQPYRCQQDPESFKLHRRAQFAAWSLATLQSYLADLQQARKNSRNLLAIKYARMENLIPCDNASPVIDTIIAMALDGQKRFIAAYPFLMRGGRPLDKAQDSPGVTSFETYLRGELETYSESTLALLLQDLQELERAGSSLSEATYRHLAAEWGFDSLQALEKTLEEKNKTSDR
jgi:hypothetical protein